MFFVTFLPQFVPAGVAVAPFIALLVAIHVTEGALWLARVILMARSIARLLRRPAATRPLDRVTGGRPDRRRAAPGRRGTAMIVRSRRSPAIRSPGMLGATA